jgi:hypothetical protein
LTSLYIKYLQNITNCHKNTKRSRNIPKVSIPRPKIGIFVLQIYHLATLNWVSMETTVSIIYAILKYLYFVHSK